MIEKSILLYNKKVSYILKKSKRAKRMRLAVYSDGKLIVTIPNRFSELKVEKFILAKSKWIVEKINFFKNLPKSTTSRLGKNGFEDNKLKALDVIEKRVKYFSKKHGFKYKQVKIKNQKTIWGSCSKNKNLNFNYKVALLPDNLRDYVIVHELCHLRELNHSRNFWKLVRKTLPNYEKLVAELKISGLSLI